MIEHQINKRYFLILSLTVITVLSVSLVFFWRTHNELIIEQIKQQARSVFKTVVLTRRWNADYGGVYVEKRPGMQSNPYLKDSDITDIHGKVYTKKNPALMTREISEYAKKASDFNLHITSLKLLNPDNKPDEFEKSSLLDFEDGKKEAFRIKRVNGTETLQYMEPLYVEKTCLKCHGHQGYKTGDVRGGISVSIPIKKAFGKSYFAMLISALLLILAVIIILYVWSYLLTNKYIKVRSRVEEDVKEKETLLQEIRHKNEELESFTYSVSHDLKSPLISIQGFSSLLEKKQKGHLDEESRFYLKRISKNVENMEQLINDLLEFSRIGRIKETMKPTSVEKIIKEIKENLLPQLTQKNIQFVVTDQLPTVYGEHTRISGLFNNLIGNAIKFSRDIPNPTIEITCRKFNDYYRFGIIDNGVGIEKKYHEKVFGLFQRLDSDHEGTGIGLAIVKKTVETWGGKIDLESEPGKGTAVYFTIPCKNDELVKSRHSREGGNPS